MTVKSEKPKKVRLTVHGEAIFNNKNPYQTVSNTIKARVERGSNIKSLYQTVLVDKPIYIAN